jgi:hypothetical protein
MTKPESKSPFDSTVRATDDHIRNALFECGIPAEEVKELVITRTKILKEGCVFADYAYFSEIEQPLFRFQVPRFCNLQDKETGKYKLVLGPHSNPALILQGTDHATLIAWQTVNRCLTNYIKDPFYELSRNAGAFFQGGGSNPEQEYIYVEFWKYKGAQAWLDAFNDELIIRKNEDLAFRSQGVQS